MSIRLEVVCETRLGQTLAISGEDSILGGFEPSKAMCFQTSETLYPTWSVEIPIPQGGSCFKLLLRSDNEEVVWEPLEDNRRWPTTGLSSGSVLRSKFGEMKMGIEASTALIEDQARRYRDLGERKGSALQENLDKKGGNAYYHAHDRKFEVPADAKVITGDGLINGGPPVLLEIGANSVTEEDRTMWLKDYSWSDSGAKVKIYVPIAEGVLSPEDADSMVQANYNATNLDVTILARPKQRLKIEKLNADIKPESCTTRVEAKKNRIVLQLVKKRETTWYSLTKK
jgi:hypothetical protein